MSWWFAVVMGLVQGLTEFIPVSSSAHLRIVPALLRQPDPGAAYTAVIQLGTLAAVLVYFAKDLAQFAVPMFKAPTSADGKLPWLIGIGTIPIVIFGVLFKKHISGELRSLYYPAFSLIAFGIIMIVADRMSSGRDSYKPLAAINLMDAVIIGLAQTLALVPGVSRSGATICAALLIGFSRTDSARYSFLLSIPAIAGAAIFEARHAFTDLSVPMSSVMIGIGVAFVSGYFSISFFIRWLGQHNLIGFAGYRIVIGVGLLIALATNFLKPF
ncbi:MAG TPA: undecaprenyl-diphosphatase UppP [Kofleriaceae bacterium]|jgi:undecaprenyl-diphosphatase